MLFPPFNMIGKVLNKINKEEAQGVIVVRYWSTQFWFSMFNAMIIKGPFVIFRRNEPTLSHPNWPSINSPRCASYWHSCWVSIRRHQPQWIYHPTHLTILGRTRPRKSTKPTSQSGLSIVTKGGGCPGCVHTFECGAWFRNSAIWIRVRL